MTNTGNVTITNSFVRSFDDSISIKGIYDYEKYIENITLEPLKEIKPKKNNTKKQENILKELEKLEVKRKNLQSLFISEEITSSDYQDMIKIIEDKRQFLNNTLKDIKEPLEEEININDIQDIITNIKKNWDYLDTNERNNFITQFIKKIDLDVIDGKPIINDIQFL